MLEEIWPHVGKTYATNLEIYGAGEAFMVRYKHEGECAGHLAEFIRFDGAKIAEIEVYLGVGSTPIG